MIFDLWPECDYESVEVIRFAFWNVIGVLSKTSLYSISKQPFAFTEFSDNAAIEGGGNVIIVNLEWDRLRLVTLLRREEEEEEV